MFFLLLDSKTSVYIIIANLLSLVIAITVHEFCHAFTADRLGDYTPRSYGRVSLNPADHIDPIGFLAILFLPIGWGKPVPINPLNFKNPKVGDVIATIVGPLSHVVMIVLTVILLKISMAFGLIGTTFINNIALQIGVVFIETNIVLMVFNFLPIPPLDGYHVFGFFLPSNIRNTIDEFFSRQNFFITIIFLFLIMQVIYPFIAYIYRIIETVVLNLL